MCALTKHPGQGDALPLPDRQPGPVLAEDGVDAIRQVGHEVGSGTIAALRRRPASDASGATTRTLSATVPRTKPGCCGIQAIWSRQLAGCVQSPARTVPELGSTTPRRHATAVDLPPPLGPIRATVSPGATSNDAQARRPRGPACRTRDVVEVHGCLGQVGLVVRRRQGPGSRGARRPPPPRPARPGWRGSARPPDAAGGTPQAQGRGRRAPAEGHPTLDSRRPTSTATTATDSVASSSRVKDDRNEMRSTFIVRLR